MPREAQLEQVANSVRRYARAHRQYERRHPEIFNPIEQERLGAELAEVVREAGGGPPHALDLGVGSGNVTAHLLRLGARVTAADVSPHFLSLVRRRFGGVETVRLNGIDLEGLPDATYDIVTAYSVLHHIPDYLGILDETARVIRPGGLVYLDHEVNDEFWRKDGCVVELRRAVAKRRLEAPGAWNPERRRWQRFLIPSKYAMAIRLKFDPEYFFGSEGDIHTWEHDHVEWSEVEGRLRTLGLEVTAIHDYLHYSADYPEDLWRGYRDRGCTDMRTLVARQPGDI
jgi:ubiquinone/menaquinone biosynthesis C-methylase UbiE